MKYLKKRVELQEEMKTLQDEDLEHTVTFRD